ncbi:hypothetical protein FTUN_6269 [Frigoriglobus tundricola]|uniref:Uncharacterized protein n=1 Tax=Frigoriglobus tundricola TaxID=2774151 RepID=A0A6M5YYR3_9BACT|nr:hypothetical protein FTUN_6269 [Frigoriglobus tundricola]
MDFRSLPQFPGAPDPPPSQRDRHVASTRYEDAIPVAGGCCILLVLLPFIFFAYLQFFFLSSCALLSMIVSGVVLLTARTRRY